MMKTTNIIAIVATSLLYIATVPSVLSFGGYVICSNRKNNVLSRNYHQKCRAQQQDIIWQRGFVLTDGIRLQHNVKLQMVNDDSSNDSIETKRRVSKPKQRILNLFRRVFRRQTTVERQEDFELEEEECVPVTTITEDAVIEMADDNSDEDVISPEVEVEESSITEDETAMEEETDTVSSIITTTNTTTPTPITITSTTRQATASPNTDLSGTWSPIVTPSFKSEYDDYLKNCSQSFMFRKVVVNGIEYQRETIRQLDNGQNLQIIAQNPAGNWNRTLIASDENNPMNATIVDPDKDTVNVEAWWEENGTRHKSVLRGKPRLKGGVFETVRYLDEVDEDVLVCDSKFLPSELEGSSSSFKYGSVLWRFQRVG